MCLDAPVYGSELQSGVGVSVLLSEVGERRGVVTHYSRVVRLKNISFSEGTKIVQIVDIFAKFL